MRIGSFEARTHMEEVAIKVLLTEDEDVVNIPEVQEMSDEEIDILAKTITQVKQMAGFDQ